MLDRLEQDLALHRAALTVRSRRHELLAANIANADTPHFKARDLDFQEALAIAKSGRIEGQGLRMTHPRHLPGAPLEAFDAALRYRVEYQGAVDGNTVNMDVERAAFVENGLQMEALLTFVNRRFEGLRRAIQGQ
ncbi:MAG: flagellar basal body rod protein FlgB [Rhodocyclaceae bacterium]|nr:flagellar basal body rod protein FlgB [Rhodocyclaceae bacterium]